LGFCDSCRSELGYTLGAFSVRSFEQPGGASESAIHHCQLNVSALRADPLWQ
jgi:hypothetical protein